MKDSIKGPGDFRRGRVFFELREVQKVDIQGELPPEQDFDRLIEFGYGKFLWRSGNSMSKCLEKVQCVCLWASWKSPRKYVFKKFFVVLIFKRYIIWNVLGFVCFSLQLSMSLLMISENVKLAREYALLGNYDSAMVYYQGVLDQMNKYLYSVKDTYLQQKWQQVRIISVVLFNSLSTQKRKFK